MSSWRKPFKTASDDERHHAEQDAESENQAIDGDEALLAPRPQVAHRHHALEGREDHRPGT